MLKNLILDIGNVICSWDPHALVSMTFSDPADQAEALRGIVNTQDWLALDKGEMSLDEAIWRAQARTQLAEADIESVYENLGTSLTALPESVAAMKRAQQQKVPMFILSNMPSHAWEHLQGSHECFSWCSGVVVSCEAQLIKPDAAIYAHVCDKFSLKPETCIFVDDMQPNVDAAIAFGMQSVQLTDKHQGGVVIDEWVAKILNNAVVS